MFRMNRVRKPQKFKRITYRNGAFLQRNNFEPESKLQKLLYTFSEITHWADFGIYAEGKCPASPSI